MTRNPKKIRQRLSAGLCNLEATGFKQMSPRQQKKITMFCLQLANASRMATQHNRTVYPSFDSIASVVASIESMVET